MLSTDIIPQEVFVRAYVCINMQVLNVTFLQTIFLPYLMIAMLDLDTLIRKINE